MSTINLGPNKINTFLNKYIQTLNGNKCNFI